MNYGMIIDHADQFSVGRLITIASIEGDKATCHPARGGDAFVLGLHQIRVLSWEVFSHLLNSQVESFGVVDPNTLPSTPGLKEFLQYNWYWMQEYNTWEIRFADPNGNPMVAWIEQRPSYCDRGNFCVKVEGLPSIDAEDGFPRFYMNLEIAKRETKEWLMWRVFKHRFSYAGV